MRASPLSFHFDYLSPYAYLAWTQIHALAVRHGRAVEPVPTLFAALLDAWGTKGPAEVAPKRVYVFKDALRSARRLGVPLAPPPSHPFHPLLALRASSLPMEPAQRVTFISALFRETWGGGRGVTESSVVAACARESGLDGEAIVRRANEPAAKDALRAQTARAIEAGVFGVPTVIVDGECFWGLDALPNLDAHLRGDDPVDDALLQRWNHIAPSAVRPAVAPKPAAPSAPLDPAVVRARAIAWIDAWNRRDLDAILTHYADDITLCSPRVVERTGAADGWLRGKDALRAYFARGLAAPGLRFELVDVTVGVGAMTVVYRRETGVLVTDTSELDGAGRIVRMVACYGRPAP